MLFVKAAVGTHPGRSTGASQQSHKICHLASLAVAETIQWPVGAVDCIASSAQEKDTVGRDTATGQIGAC